MAKQVKVFILVCIISISFLGCSNEAVYLQLKSSPYGADLYCDNGIKGKMPRVITNNISNEDLKNGFVKIPNCYATWFSGHEEKMLLNKLDISDGKTQFQYEFKELNSSLSYELDAKYGEFQYQLDLFNQYAKRISTEYKNTIYANDTKQNSFQENNNESLSPENNVGNIMFGSNGTSTQKIGNIYMHSDGTSTQKIGDTYLHSNGTSTQKVGNTYLNSNGTSTQKVGNMYMHSDGTTSIQIGNQIISNKPVKTFGW